MKLHQFLKYRSESHYQGMDNFWSMKNMYTVVIDTCVMYLSVCVVNYTLNSVNITG